MMSCYRYIELNPVRANLVKDPEDYSWSSYHVNGLGDYNESFTPPHTVYESQGIDEYNRQKAYRGLFLCRWTRVW